MWGVTPLLDGRVALLLVPVKNWPGAAMVAGLLCPCIEYAAAQSYDRVVFEARNCELLDVVGSSKVRKRPDLSYDNPLRSGQTFYWLSHSMA